MFDEADALPEVARSVADERIGLDGVAHIAALAGAAASEACRELARLCARETALGRPRLPIRHVDGAPVSDPGHLDYVARAIEAARESGRVLVLCTSYALAEELAARGRDAIVHVRGTRLASWVEAFRTDAHAVLRGLYLDCETTGTDPEYDDMIELAMLPFTYTPEGCIVHVLHHEARAWRIDPGRALPPEIVALTGLTDEMVRGQRLDVEAANGLIGASNLVVAHNAKFDRAFCEKLLPAARDAAWACSLAEVPWTEAGFANRSLHCLACSLGVYARDRHRALADCEVGLWLLANALPHTGQGVFAALRERASATTIGLWAVRAPFAAKGLLKARRYRWMPEPRGGIAKSWWTELAPECVAAEIDWLREHVYQAFGRPCAAGRGVPAAQHHGPGALASRPADQGRAP